MWKIEIRLHRRLFYLRPGRSTARKRGKEREKDDRARGNQGSNAALPQPFRCAFRPVFGLMRLDGSPSRDTATVAI